MMLGQLRVSIVGSQTQCNPKNKKPYTVYRTAVNFRGQCYQRLIRYSQFQRFHKKLHMRDTAAQRAIVFPHKEWTRSVSLQDEVVEARQVLLDEYMDNVTSHELTSGCFDQLLRLLKVGDYNSEPITMQGHALPAKTPIASASHRQHTADVVAPLANATPSLSSDDEQSDKREQQQQHRGIGSGVIATSSAHGATDHIGNATREQQSPTTLRAMPSTAETDQTTDDEHEHELDSHRLMTSTSTINSEDYIPTDDEDEHSDHSDPIDGAAKSTTKPQASASPPVRRPKKVKFHVRTSESHVNDVTSAPTTTNSAGSAALSPEHKYRSRIAKQMSNIEDMFACYSPVDRVPSKFALATNTQTQSPADYGRSESL